MSLLLVRHPRPLDAAGICYGRTDLAVDPVALESTVAQVRPRLGTAPSAVSSPARRCRELAERLAPGRVQIEPSLQELDFGAWEGRRWDAIPRAELDEWAADLWNYRPGGGESAAQLATRVRPWLEACASASAPVLAVTHAGVIRVALVLCRRVAPTALASLQIPFGSAHACAP